MTDLITDLRKMDPDDFEHLVAGLWEEMGWETTVTSSTRDGGIDVIAEKSEPFPKKEVIQAKRYSSSVGVREIREYSYLKRGDVDSVVVVTTGEFTNSAEETAEEGNIKLLNGIELVKLIGHLDAHDIVGEYIQVVEEPTPSPLTKSPSTENQRAEMDFESISGAKNKNIDFDPITREISSLIKLGLLIGGGGGILSGLKVILAAATGLNPYLFAQGIGILLFGIILLWVFLRSRSSEEESADLDTPDSVNESYDSRIGGDGDDITMENKENQMDYEESIRSEQAYYWTSGATRRTLENDEHTNVDSADE